MRLKKIFSATLVAVLISLVVIETNQTLLHTNLNQGLASAATTSATLIKWSGYTWIVRNSRGQATNPGPNYWSNSTQNVWVDASGYLHLKITKSNDRWYSAAVTCSQTLGYGTYVFYIIGRIDTLDKNVVLGLFNYKDDTHEADIEFARWGNSTYPNGWFSVQPKPFTAGVNQQVFNFKLYGSYTTSYISWKSNSISFRTFAGHYPVGSEPAANVIQKLTCNKAVSCTGATVNINFWLYDGHPPSNGQSAEVIIKGFQFIPA